MVAEQAEAAFGGRRRLSSTWPCALEHALALLTHAPSLTALTLELETAIAARATCRRLGFAMFCSGADVVTVVQSTDIAGRCTIPGRHNEAKHHATKEDGVIRGHQVTRHLSTSSEQTLGPTHRGGAWWTHKLNNREDFLAKYTHLRSKFQKHYQQHRAPMLPSCGNHTVTAPVYMHTAELSAFATGRLQLGGTRQAFQSLHRTNAER